MFTVTNGGYNARHPRTFLMSRPKGLNNYLLLIIKTHGFFEIAGINFVAEPGSAVIIDRNTPYQYHNPNGDYVDDWLHFECSDDSYLKNTGIIFNEVYPLRNPAKFTLYIEQILWERNYTPEKYRYDNVSMLFHVLINNLILAYQEKDSTHINNPYYTKLQNVRLTLQAAPYEKYSPNIIAEQLGISASYFQHLYTTVFGISFQSDLINIRMDYAKNLVKTTNLTIEQISEMCGYSSEVHFYRQFRKKVNMSPTAYRRSQK
jgi:AraC family transcriptional regulator, arabinose operon regulatory protein